MISCLPSCIVTRQIFYSRCGYKFSESVCAFGGSSNLNLGKFAASPTVPSVLTDQKVGLTQMGPGQFMYLLDQCIRVSAAAVSPPIASAAPPPPPPPGLPPPPPPPPCTVWLDHDTSPAAELASRCDAVYRVPVLPPVLPRLDIVPDIDMAGKKEKNTEDNSSSMFMKKSL